MNYIVALIQLVLLVFCALPVFYLLFLMLAAAFYRRPRFPDPKKETIPATSTPDHFVILIPAHNEALTLPATLETIKALRADSANPLIVVVADNCSDETAELARQAGVLVYERHDAELRGKGHALQWAIRRLMAEYDPSQFNTLVIFDADTVPDAAFLQEAQYVLKRGGQVLQGRYDVLKPTESWRTILLYAAFVIYNHIRPLGRVTLGLSDGLRGNGMVFRREILERFPWEAFSLVEDIEYTTRLALAGLSVTYVPQAKLYGQAAATGKQATSQRMRWEGGRWAQAKQDVPPLLRRAIAKADFVAFDRAFDLIIPPLALLVMGLVALTVVDVGLWLVLGGELLGATVLAWLGLLAGMVLFVFGGLLVARAPFFAFIALLFAPFYIIWKMRIYAKMLFRRIPQEWVRTSRSKIELADAQSQVGLEKEGNK
ncbi:MAG: glycosyltransferase family 2 protein [Chloroflexota bacterium]|nr:glycosyltransferase family 2 protein [Chloroflexota bacterium]